MSGRLDRGDRVDRHAPVRREQRQLVDRHVLEQALAVALEALGQLRLRVRVVVHVGGDGAGPGLLGLLQRLAHVRRHVLVVPHVHGHLPLRREAAHRLELLDGGRARLLEVDGGAAGFDDLAQQARVIRRPPRNERHPRPVRLRHVRHGLAEGHAFRARLRSPGGERGAWRRVGARAEEPRLHHRAERRRGSVAVQHLLGMVPPHAPLGHASADTDHVARGFGGHDAARSPQRGTRPRRRQQEGRMAGDEQREHSRAGTRSGVGGSRVPHEASRWRLVAAN